MAPRLTHTCPHCGELLPYKRFGPATGGHGWRGEDGERRRSWCRACENAAILARRKTPEGRAKRREYMARYRLEHAEELAAYQRAYRETPSGRKAHAKAKAKARRKAKRSAKALQARREVQRLYAWEQRRLEGRREQGPRAERVIPGVRNDRYLDAGPFRAWLEVNRAAFDTQRDFVAWLGTTERMVERLEREARSIRLSTVDEILTNVSVPLWEVYPSLYPGVDFSFLREVLTSA